MVGLETGQDPLRETFTKNDRLLKRADFLRLSKSGKKVQNRQFIAYICKNECGRCRIGLTVTRKVGNAAKRNRIKRLAREYFRKNRQILSEYFDISLIVKKESVGLGNKALVLALENIFAKIGKYQKD